MPIVELTSISCGVMTIFNLDGVEAFLATYKDYCQRTGVKYPLVLFSDVNYKNCDGPSIAKKLKKYGTVTASPSKINPNSGNRIRVWIWTPSEKFKTSIRGTT